MTIFVSIIFREAFVDLSTLHAIVFVVTGGCICPYAFFISDVFDFYFWSMWLC